MRALRIATSLLAVLSLMGGTIAISAVAAAEPNEPIRQVAGSLDVHRLPGGTFDVEDRIFRYRDYSVAGSGHSISDPRLAGYLVSDWNWDILASGGQPVPAWGDITIDGADGTWQGSFSGIRDSDFKPVGIRAMLFGDGAYEGLCATLDITTIGLAEDSTWILDGVVHPVDTMG